MRLLTAALCLALAAPASALDLSAMSATERTAFGQAVREYLLENPEVLMEAIGVLEQKREADQVATDLKIMRDNADMLYTNPADWVGGNPAGDVTVVEFLDYRCGYCRKAWEDVENLVAADGNIRLVLKEFPILGEDSLASSQFAIAARKLGGDETYKKAHDALISLVGPADEAALSDLAEDLGLDPAKVAAEMMSDETAAIIRANHQLATLLQINGTPTFVVNETMVRGYVPMDGMRQIVDGQRKKAN
ncbi:Protein-disulfide isomerase [Gemmobacter megaterium]|uniref:Protein-disulfide isomerase n=1 Tax=Gemmobacter megaterium TaxID=1086013 RepID=A0A1N7LZB8_9RHOB|nr:DsbA family protein [Gemmobacter megaterium]GGE09744.1 DSBA oxidoreductase [Gemmobacter megaterium]SIS79162.1 Protein-disulfide isomerase [Gemmobacter megaterium]